MLDYLFSLLVGLIAAVCVFAPHEFAHAFVAYKCGDPTAKMQGRMTLNPFKHLDLLGIFLMALVGFGWARPVPVNPYNFKHYRSGMFLTAIAGISVNYMIAFLAYPLFLVVLNFMPVVPFLYEFLWQLFFCIFSYSLCSVVFNLLPLFPLDGFRVIESFTRELNPIRRFLRNYGQVILIILIAESYLCGMLVDFGYTWAQYADVLGYAMQFATGILGYPITALWNLIF